MDQFNELKQQLEVMEQIAEHMQKMDDIAQKRRENMLKSLLVNKVGQELLSQHDVMAAAQVLLPLLEKDNHQPSVKYAKELFTNTQEKQDERSATQFEREQNLLATLMGARSPDTPVAADTDTATTLSTLGAAVGAVNPAAGAVIGLGSFLVGLGDDDDDDGIDSDDTGLGLVTDSSADNTAGNSSDNGDMGLEPEQDQELGTGDGNG